MKDPGGWYYVIRVSPEGRPDPDSGPDGPMTFDEALALQDGPDPRTGWRSVAVGVIVATGEPHERVVGPDMATFVFEAMTRPAPGYTEIANEGGIRWHKRTDALDGDDGL